MEAIHIRGLVIDPPLLLAPMAGVTHSAFRRLVLHFGGAGLLSTEMLAAKRLPAENPLLSPYLIKTKAEKPLSYQLLVTHPREIAGAVPVLHRLEAQAIDLNMGCPAPKVRQAGGGCSLMGQPDLVREIVAGARVATSLPLTAKIRLGASLDEETLRDFCLLLQEEGIDLLTVHARLSGEPFCRRPHWEWVAKVKSWLRIPVVVNGGIFSLADAQACLRKSHADGLMLGRGAVVRPWLFREIADFFSSEASSRPVIQLPEVFRLFVEGLALFPEKRRIGRLKEFSHYFARNYDFGHHLASAVQASATMEEAARRAMDFFTRSDPAAACFAPCLSELKRKQADPFSPAGKAGVG